MKNEAQILKALGDETRLRILALLLDGELCVCELMAALELPQSTVSRHLSYLKNSGWIEDRREGVWMYYRLVVTEGSLVESLIPVLKKFLVNHQQHLEALTQLESFHDNEKQKTC
jgi:ArsR family transcriptional regulator